MNPRIEELLQLIAMQHLWQSAALLVLAAVLVKICPLAAGTRAWAWLAVLTLAALLPCLVLAPAAPQVHALAPLAVQAASVTMAVSPVPMSAPPSHVLSDATRATLFIWAAGLAWQLRGLWIGWRAARRLRRAATAEPRLDALGGTVDILASDGIASPLVIGFVHPCILVPRAVVASLLDQQLADVIAHEMAHIRRGDAWTSLLQRVLMAIYWWSPAFRMIGTRLDLAREMACDAAAVQRTGKPAAYAGALLACIDAAAGPRGQLLGHQMAGAGSPLKQRIEALLHSRPAAPRHALASVVWCASLVVVMGAAVAATPRLAAVQGGVGLNAGVDGEGTPLIVAARAGNVQVVETLLSMGAQVDLAWPGDGNPLIAAVKAGQGQIVERLVAHGADLNAITPYDETPLINAARTGNLALVTYLVAHGARVNLGVWADGHRWRTPLNQAANGPVRAFLLSKGAS